MNSPAHSAAKPSRDLLPKKAPMAKVFPKEEQRLEVTELPSGAADLSARELAAVLLDQALILWGERGESKQVAAALDVDESLVRKWRRTDERASPSLIQLLTLGPEFLSLLFKVSSRHHGWEEQAFLELAQALGHYALHREK